MEIPKSSEIYLPFLEFLATDGKDHRLPECVSAMGKHFHLSQSQMEQEFVKTKQKSKPRKKFYIRVAQAAEHFGKPGAIEQSDGTPFGTRPRLGNFHITPKGRILLGRLRGMR